MNPKKSDYLSHLYLLKNKTMGIETQKQREKFSPCELASIVGGVSE
jgi:hypothetical protein